MLYFYSIREYGHDFHVILMPTDIYHRPLIKVKKMLFFFDYHLCPNCHQTELNSTAVYDLSVSFLRFRQHAWCRNLRWFVELSAFWKQEIYDRQGQNGSQIWHFFPGEFLPNWNNQPHTSNASPNVHSYKPGDALWRKSNACRGLLFPIDT